MENENIFNIFYCSFGTNDDKALQILKVFGNAKYKEVFLNSDKIYALQSEIEKRLPNYCHDYGMGGFVYSVPKNEVKHDLEVICQIIKSHNLENKFITKGKIIISKDLEYSEAINWMNLPENKYEQKVKVNNNQTM